MFPWQDDSDRGKSSKRKGGGGKNRKTKSGKLEYGGALERMPADEKYMQQSPFVGKQVPFQLMEMIHYLLCTGQSSLTCCFFAWFPKI